MSLGGLLVTAIVLTGPFVAPSVQSANVCSGDGIRDVRQLFSPDSTFHAIVLAEVTREQTLTEVVQEKSVPSFGAVGILVSVEPHHPVHVATVRPVVVLTGNLTSGPITVGPLMGTAPDCSGGLYLEPGAKVLLSLRRHAI
jgi:hypothetical protein